MSGTERQFVKTHTLGVDSELLLLVYIFLLAFTHFSLHPSALSSLHRNPNLNFLTRSLTLPRTEMATTAVQFTDADAAFLMDALHHLTRPLSVRQKSALQSQASPPFENPQVDHAASRSMPAHWLRTRA